MELTAEQVASRMEWNKDSLEIPRLKQAVRETITAYEQQIKEEFTSKHTPDGAAWPEWSESYRRKMAGRQAADYVGPLTPGTSSHTLMVLTGTLESGVADMVQAAKVTEDGFETQPASTALPPYASYHDHLLNDGESSMPDRSFLGMGEHLIEQAIDFGVEEMNRQLFEAWS